MFQCEGNGSPLIAHGSLLKDEQEDARPDDKPDRETHCDRKREAPGHDVFEMLDRLMFQSTAFRNHPL